MKLKRTKGIGGWRRIYKLYLAAFPAYERKPFLMIWNASKRGKADVWTIESGGEFIGMAITMNSDDKVLLDYFAIDENKRSSGYGSKALRKLQEHYSGKRFFLEIETVFTSAKNLDERIRRKNFYLSNGMSEMRLMADVFGTKLEVLGFGCRLTFDEYRDVYLKAYGRHTAANIRHAHFPDET